MTTRRASDVFVECLEAEGVKHVFGIPGEETLDLNESLSRSAMAPFPCQPARERLRKMMERIIA